VTKKKKTPRKNKNKTQQTDADPIAFIDAIANETKRNDAHELVEVMRKVTGKPAKMWGASIVGFDQHHYQYESGREGDMPITGFSPRGGSLVLYLGPGLDNAKLTAKLGKHKMTKGCLYINKLDDVDRSVLRELVTTCVARMRKARSPV